MQSSRVQQTDWDKVFRVELGKVEGFLFCLFGSFVFSILAVFPDWLTAGLVERMSFLGPGPSQTNLWPDPKPVVVVVESEGFAGQTGSDCQKESDYFFKWDNWRGGVFLALPFHVVKKKLGVGFFLGFFCFCFLFLFVFLFVFFICLLLLLLLPRSATPLPLLSPTLASLFWVLLLSVFIYYRAAIFHKWTI